MSYWCYLCLLPYSGVQHILCCVLVFIFFVLCLVYPLLPVSLDCSFWIAPSVFSNVYLSCVLCTLCCQFLWIVHFGLPLRYSLTFIMYPMLPVSLDCSFWIAPSVFSNVYYVPYVASFSGLLILDCPFGIL
jgi:hypothetical protein